MRRSLFLFALLAAVSAHAFTLIDLLLAPAPPLVWYEAHAPATGAAPESTDFIPRFLPYGSSGLGGVGSTSFGLDAYQFDTITCSWGTVGVTSGATDTMTLSLIQKSDAGVVCTCSLSGLCTDAVGSEHTCNCGGVKYLRDAAALSGYALQLTSATNCGTNPGYFICAIPFRH